jgi:hypothetical protein
VSKTFARTLTLAALTTALCGSVAAQAAKPINLALFTPIQIFKDSEQIEGFRFNLFYGRNAGGGGLDLGLVNHQTGAFTGVQWGGGNIAEGNFLGWQNGFINYAKAEMKGVQSGVVNYAGSMKGVQFGLVNYAKRMEKGLQIGLANIIESNGWLPFMIIVNGKF